MSTATAPQLQINITNGPSDDELVAAWRYAFDPNHPDFTVEFNGQWSDTVAQATILPFTAQITGLNYESGMRGMLLIQANLRIAHGSTWRGIGFYDAKTRTGYFKKGYFAWTEETD